MFFSFPSRAWQRLPWWCGLNQQLCLHLAHSFCKSTTLYQRYMVFTIYKTTTIKINLQTNVITKKMLKINQTRNQANSKKNRRTRFKVNQGRRKHFKLGGARHFEGTFFLKKKAACSKHEKSTSLFIKKSWGARATSAPRFLRI